MATIRVNSTEDFDGGTKQASGSNYTVETFTDNPVIAEGILRLGYRGGDKFAYADPDAVTWKWKVGMGTDPSGVTRKIEDGKLELGCIGEATTQVVGLRLDDYIANTDFDVRVVIEEGDNWIDGFSTIAYTQLNRIANPGGDKLQCILYRGQEAHSGEYGLSLRIYKDMDPCIWTIWVPNTYGKVAFRMVRTGVDAYIYYDETGVGDSWELGASQSWKTGGLYNELILQNSQNTVSASGLFDDYGVHDGSMQTASFMTSGSWTSPEYTSAPGQQLRHVIVSNSYGDANNNIARVDILDASDDSVLSTWTGSMQETDTLFGADFDNGFAVTRGVNFKVKIFPVGESN